METYTFIILVALFLGVLSIIAMMERRRRMELAQAKQLYETLVACVGWLQAIHSGSESQMGKIAEALSQLQAAVESATKSSSESAVKLSSTAVHAVEQAASRLETVVQQHQKALDTTLIRAADRLSESSASRSKALLSEAQNTTKAVQDLQASLVESAKF